MIRGCAPPRDAFLVRVTFADGVRADHTVPAFGRVSGQLFDEVDDAVEQVAVAVQVEPFGALDA